MGNFRIVIDAAGGHGDAREVGDGGELPIESYPEYSVDKVAFQAIEALKVAGASNITGTLTHWPETEGEVVDDLVTKKRKGSF